MTPPKYIIPRECLRKIDTARMLRSKNSAKNMNGSPSPRQYAELKIAPRAALASLSAITWTAASVGPMQGVQPIAKIAPSKKAPTKVPVGIR